jgi:hypothetical protein
MAFQLVSVMVDVLTGRAIVVANDISGGGNSSKSVQVQFPFNPPPAEAAEQARVIAETKRVLQQVLNEI